MMELSDFTTNQEPAREPIIRPNGTTYRPRKIIAYFVYDADEIPEGVLVLGTHDMSRAQSLADALMGDWDHTLAAVSPEAGWYRDSFAGGHRIWAYDTEHGRAGVLFRELVEKT